MSDIVHSAGLQAGYSGPATSGTTVGELIDRYMAAYTGRDSTRPNRLAWWQARVGDVLLSDLDDDRIFHLLEDLAQRPARVYMGKDVDGKPIFRAKNERIAPGTVNRYANALAAVFTWAIRKRLVPKGWTNPCSRVERQPESQGVVRFLTDAEAKRLLAACRESRWNRLYLIVLMGLTTGARKGELIRLRVGDIDLDRRVATVAVTKNLDPRLLPLTDAVVAELRAHMPRDKGRLIFGSRLDPNRPYAFETAWRQALSRAGIKRFRFHDLRHSCASSLARSGATLLEIADVLGHRQISVTKRYSHLAVGHKSALVDRVLGGLK